MLNSRNNHLRLIKEFYGDARAERSGVPYINHIIEGLVVMDHIKASDQEMEAYCLHPVFQSDKDLYTYLTNKNVTTLINKYHIPHHTVVLAMEYRRVANSYLSHHKIGQLAEGIFPQVRHMLIGDKVQNYKDFLVYHQATHPRKNALKLYFHNWFYVLGITPSDFEVMCDKINVYLRKHPHRNWTSQDNSVNLK